MNEISFGSGIPEDPWILKTPSLASEFQAWRDEDKAALVVQVGSTRLMYQLSCIADADEGKPAVEGSVEAWARDAGNPVGGYYGMRKGYRGRFGNYVPPVLERLGLAEVEHGARGNRMRAV